MNVLSGNDTMMLIDMKLIEMKEKWIRPFGKLLMVKMFYIGNKVVKKQNV